MKKLLTILSVLLVFTACTKYDDGPAISLRSKTARLSNTWQVSAAFKNGVDNTANFNIVYGDYLLDIRKDNSYTIRYDPNSASTFRDDGKWKFNDNKTHVILVGSNGDVIDYRILRLKESEFWIRFNESNGDEWEVHLLPHL